MAATYFGILNSFDHLTHDWVSFKNRLQQWFIANDLVDADKIGVKRKVIVVLTALSESTYKLATDLLLPRKIEEEEFVSILEALDKHFIPKRHGFAERAAFYAATQRADEGHAQWAARLRGLAAYCEFGNLEESLLDRFVIGMTSGPERDKLFTQDIKVLTLAKAVELAASVRCARAAAANVPAAPASSTVYKIRDKKVNEELKCAVCGFKNHKTMECRFKNFSCRKCGEKGHLRRMCSNKTKCVKHVEEISEAEGMVISHIRCKSDTMPMSVRVLINGVTLQFEVDKGAAITAISDTTYYNNFADVPLSHATKTLKGYAGGRIVTMGVIQVPVVYLGRTHTLTVYVVRDGGPPLLGRDFIKLFNLEISQIKYCTTENNNIVNHLISDFPSVFSDKLGSFTKYKVRLSLIPDAKPVFRKARPVAYALRSKIDDELDRLLKLGIITPVQYSDYASPIVPVLKKNGEIRICAEYSATINKQLVIEKYPLPTVDEVAWW